MGYWFVLRSASRVQIQGVQALILIILSKEGLYLVILESTPEPAVDISSNRVNSCDSDDDTPGFIVALGDEQ